MKNHPLVFKYFAPALSMISEQQIIDTGAVLLGNLHGGFAHNRASLIGNYNVPILANSFMTYVGTVTTSILLVTTFSPRCTNLVGRSPES